MKTAAPETRPFPEGGSTSTRHEGPATMLDAMPKQMRQIVVAIDFSACSKAALRHAIDLAEIHDASLLLVTVVEPPRVFCEPNVQPYADWDKSILSIVQKQLDELVQAEVPVSFTVKKEVSTGNAATKIVAAAAEAAADLIIIGTHGYTGIKHVILGSTAERVVRDSHCSVLVVHESDKRPWSRMGSSPARILVPVDFSAHSKRAAQYALEWGTKLKAQVELLHVVPIHYATGEYDQIDYQLLAVEQTTSGNKQLDQWAKAFGCSQTPVLHGRPATEIVEFAQDQDIGLIVIATRGQTGLKHLLLGSTTEEVVRRAHCPVLVLRW